MTDFLRLLSPAALDTPATSRLVLVRHARVLQGSGLCYGHSDIAAEHAASQHAAQHFVRDFASFCARTDTDDPSHAATNPHFAPQHIQCSPRLRCLQLARELALLRPDWPHACIEPEIAEVHFGTFEMQAWDSIPAAQFNAWMEDFAHHRFGGVESTWEVLQRVASALLTTHAKAQALPGIYIWITHAGVIRALQYLQTYGLTPPRSAEQWPTSEIATGTWHVMPLAENA